METDKGNYVELRVNIQPTDFFISVTVAAVKFIVTHCHPYAFCSFTAGARFSMTQTKQSTSGNRGFPEIFHYTAFLELPATAHAL